MLFVSYIVDRSCAVLFNFNLFLLRIMFWVFLEPPFLATQINLYFIQFWIPRFDPFELAEHPLLWLMPCLPTMVTQFHPLRWAAALTLGALLLKVTGRTYTLSVSVCNSDTLLPLSKPPQQSTNTPYPPRRNRSTQEMVDHQQETIGYPSKGVMGIGQTINISGKNYKKIQDYLIIHGTLIIGI